MMVKHEGGGGVRTDGHVAEVIHGRGGEVGAFNSGGRHHVAVGVLGGDGGRRHVLGLLPAVEVPRDGELEARHEVGHRRLGLDVACRGQPRTRHQVPRGLLGVRRRRARLCARARANLEVGRRWGRRGSG